MDYGCIGEHLKHSFSKEIHSLLADYDYEIKELSREQLPEFMQSKEFKAINVTIPYKLEVIPFLDEVSPIAKSIGAVNTIVNKGGALHGFNTDFYGLRALILRSGIEIKDKTVLILGSGGTSKTAKVVLEDLQAAKILRASRSPKDGFMLYSQISDEAKNIDVIINTTPVGMYPNIFGSAVDIADFENLSGIVDAVYNPLRSELVLKGKERGIKSVGGLYMLVAQAAFAYQKFLDTDISMDKIDEAYKKIFEDKENIVIIGMPACGKTTIGKRLSKALDRELIDTDEEIERLSGATIPEIFQKFGEAHFRALEKEVIEQISSSSGCVIATGGGAVLNPENIFNLRKNGRIYFLDRPLDKLIPTSSRPLASSVEAIEQRYAERYERYCASADAIIKACEDIEGNTNMILEEFRRNRE